MRALACQKGLLSLSFGLSLGLSFGLSLLSGCGVPISLDPGQQASPVPSPDSMARPLPDYSSPPLAPVSQGPEPAPAASAPPEPAASPSVSSSTSPALDLSVSAATTLNGHVYDEFGQPVEASVSLRSVSGAVYSARVETRGGVYVFNAVPAGMPLELSAEAPGYARVSRVVLPKSNRLGDPAANRFDFGGSGEDHLYLLSRAPRVIALSPEAGHQFEPGARPSFSLRFDRAVDTDSVEAALQVSLAQDLSLGELSLARGDTLLRPRQLSWDWNDAGTEASVGLPELPGLARNWKLWLQFTGPIASREGQAGATPEEGFGPIWSSGAPSDRHELGFAEDEDELRLEGLDQTAAGLRLRFSKFLSFSLGEAGEPVHSEGLAEAGNYALQIDIQGDGSYGFELPASSVSLDGDEIDLGFGSLTAYAGKNARLAFRQGYLPADLAGHRLSDFVSPLLGL